MNGHAAMAAAHLDVVGVRVEAGLPSNHAVAAGGDRDVADTGGWRLEGRIPEVGATVALESAAREETRHAQRAQGGHRLDLRADERMDGEGVRVRASEGDHAGDEVGTPVAKHLGESAAAAVA